LGDLFEIRAVCNRSLDKAQAYVRAAGLQTSDEVFVCSDWREVVARDDVDALVVALPVEHNLEVARAAAAAGKHALLEKPTACTLADAAALVRLAEQRRDDVAIMIAENYPYKRSLQAMARLVMGRACCCGLVLLAPPSAT
jgi:predicted dehydrogenase